MDTFTKDFYYALGILLIFLVFWWCYRVASLIEIFLKAATDVLGSSRLPGATSLLLYRKDEVKGTYKGREVIVGIIYSGFRGEFLPLPTIRMGLKETIGYNLNRLPTYAAIEKKSLIFKVKLSVLWGVFDKNYPSVFSKNYLVVALEKLFATAEDVERGRTMREIFK
jgi:hypothetical protein